MPIHTSETDDLLDNAVWHALTTRHAAFALGDEHAKRYPADMVPVAAFPDPARPAFDRLVQLLAQDEAVFLVNTPAPPATLFTVVFEVTLRQMLCEYSVEAVDDDIEISTLSEKDVPDMLALIEITQPGPFLSRTHELGTYLGIRVNNRLIAMAGERFFLHNLREISAICTHPDFTGRGYARRLLSHLVNMNLSQGIIPFLHVTTDNPRAIGLYERLGFVTRRDIPAMVVKYTGQNI